MSKIYTVKELAKYFKCSDLQALRMVQGEQVKAFKVGREWRVTEDAINEFIAKGCDR
jgi:excisionase family DNA binding protein